MKMKNNPDSSLSLAVVSLLIAFMAIGYLLSLL
jgi:hypothetical protein